MKFFQSTFKEENTFDERLEESVRVMTKYPERKPVICERLNERNDTPQIDKKKYLINNDLTIANLLFVIRERLTKRSTLKPNDALFLFANGKMLPSSATLAEIYDAYKDKDGFLYIQFSKENVFGCIKM
jgi:GABA(A) receptor-associated protein